METSSLSIGARVARLNSEIIGKTLETNCTNINRENLLDSLQVLYDECRIENLQKFDKNIEFFVEKYKATIDSLRRSRVNVGDFEIKNVIGRGHFGEVHMVLEKQTGDIYAMKSIRKCDSLDQKRTSFIEERNIMAKCRSHWLTSLQYAFQDSTHLFFIMEYHPGGDLLGLLYREGGTLPESAAIFYIAELTLALQDLHEMGYVHRDIKPDNLLLDRCGHLKLADFGSAAKINSEGFVTEGPPVGTPDYIAPEVLQCTDNRNSKTAKYGVSCDYWSMGVLAFELTIGNTPFCGDSTPIVYSKIMDHKNSLKFPPDVVLSQAFVSFVKGLVTDQKSRLTRKDIVDHPLFKNVHLDGLKDQVPPFVPKISSQDDTSNFGEIQSCKKPPSIENFKKKTQFSGRNLPFIGFTYTPDAQCMETGYNIGKIKDETVQNLKSEVSNLRRRLVQNESTLESKKAMEKKLEEKTRKMESVENLRNQLERDMAKNIAENAALKRTIELERKERSELEVKALELIKSAKLKWETLEKNKIDAINSELGKQKEKVAQLTVTNEMLNGQLQHALKVEASHQKSIDKVENLSRRSVIGLESRLDKVTADTQNVIADLQKRLGDETYKKNSLERQMTKLKEKEINFAIKLKNSEDNYRHLQGKVNEAEAIIQDLGHKVTDLEEDAHTVDSFRNDMDQLQFKLEESQKVIKDLENRNTVLELDNKRVDYLKSETIELNNLILSLQKELKKQAELEIDLEKEKEKNTFLQNKIQESKNVLSENQELKELRTKYWRTEKDLNNAKIDKRILERELKETQTANKELSERIQSLNETCAENQKLQERALLEMSGINDSLSMELIKTKESCKRLEERYANEREKSDESKSVVAELKSANQTKDDGIKQLNDEVTELKYQVGKTEGEKVRLIALIESLNREKLNLSGDLEKANREMGNKQLNLEALREACMLLEGQVIEYEKISESYKAQLAASKANTEKLIADVCAAKREAQQVKQAANEEKSFRLLTETKAKHLSDDIDCLRNECTGYKQQCNEYKQYSNNLAEELSVAEEKIVDMEITIKSYERHAEELMAENNQLKEEVTEYLTQVHMMKETNYKLNQQNNDLKNSKNDLQRRENELNRVLQEKSCYYREREMKLDATIKQQLKLIDFLQMKIDENSHKKKTLTDKIFGLSKKENQPPPSLAMNYRDLGVELQKERTNNKALHEEIHRLKAATCGKIVGHSSAPATKIERHKSEIASPKTKEAIQKLMQSPTAQNNDLYRQNSLQRMHHNIPHRFDSKLCKKTVVCPQCSKQIAIGRYMSVCKECATFVHSNCANLVPQTCGLPQAFAQHFKDSLVIEKNDTKSREAASNNDVVHAESWIKIPGKVDGWEKRYVVLTSTHLNLYTQPPKDKSTTLLESIALRSDGDNGKVVLEPLASEIDVPIARSDMPFVFKIEFAQKSTCWPPKSFLFLTLSLEDKEKWIKALPKIFQTGADKSHSENIVTVSENLTVNCLTELTDSLIILGTDKGLRFYSDDADDLQEIEGLEEVHQISVMRATNSVVMIAKSKSVLVRCLINHLINVAQCKTGFAKATLNYDAIDIKGLNGFHIMRGRRRTLCVATPKQLIILNYDVENDEFVPVRILDTAEPTSCILLTDHSIIVGANKFFEIDVNTFEADEFLDTSDAKLAQVSKCYKIGSFPVGVTETSNRPKEYLITFNEFSIFVDEFGRLSRPNEIKSVHLPLAVFYIKPFLYIVQFTGVEIIKIDENTCNNLKESTENLLSAENVRIRFEKFQCLGCNDRGVYIFHDNIVKLLDAKRILNVDDDSVDSESVDTDSDRFSLTSSMVRSLDGHLSDAESVECKEKVVKFSQTDL